MYRQYGGRERRYHFEPYRPEKIGGPSFFRFQFSRTRRRRKQRTPFVMLRYHHYVVSVILWSRIFLKVHSFVGWRAVSNTNKPFSRVWRSMSEVGSGQVVQSTSEGMSRGDSRGAAVLLEGLSVSRGPAQILEDINWRVEPRSKWAVIGPNGAGKSTLLKAIMGEISYEGKITIGTTLTVGYLQQTSISGSNLSVFDEACSAMVEITKAKDELQLAEKLVADSKAPSEKDLARLDKAIQKFERIDGFKQEQEVSSMLKGLGFQDMDQPCNTLSGGWKMRVSLAKILLSKPSLCILDEPTNHLDRGSRRWLAEYLKNYEDGAMILVTHDVELLDAMASIAEVQPGGQGISIYKSCTYSEYLALKQKRQESAEREFRKNTEKAAKLQEFVDKYGASATKASAAQSRVKQLKKMKEMGVLEAPMLEQKFRPSLRLIEPPSSTNDILMKLTAGSIGYDARSPLISHANLEIRRGMKILIRGHNGCGKSTLFRSLRGELPLLSGEVTVNEQIQLGVFTQDLAQELDPDERAVDLVTQNVRDFNIGISDEDARKALGRLGLTGEKATRRLRDLSGGEKARVALAMFSLKPSNLYLLDECSNHLNSDFVELLANALNDWGGDLGSIVIISHDKSFCSKIRFTHVVTIDNGTLTMEQREVNHLDWDNSALAVQPSIECDEGTANIYDEAPLTSPVVDPALRKRIFNAPKRIKQIEDLISSKEEEIAQFDNRMLASGNDVGLLVDLTEKRNGVEEEICELMEEWEELEILINSSS